MRTILVSACSLIAIVSATPALAQDATQLVTEVGRATIYQQGYFTAYSPTNALEIAQHVPGFTLDLGNSDVRGFAAAAGNVVINGARPSSKSESLETVLRRIPAKRVSRVEVQPGDLYGSDYAGRSQVLNIVMSEEGGFDATVTSFIRHRYPDKWLGDVSGTALWKKGDVSFNVAAGTQTNDSQEEGYDLVSTVDGMPLEYRRKHNDQRDRAPYASANFAWEQAPDRSIRANIRYQHGPYLLKQRNHVTPTDGPAHDDSLVLDYLNNTFEIGGDITRPLLGGAVKLVGLATRAERDNFDAYYGNDPAGVLVGGFEQRTKAQRDESIGRLSWTRSNLAGFNVELGAEYVYNVLDNDLRLDLIEDDGTRTPIDLPIAQAKVSEKRGQFFANVGHPITSTLRADATLAYETSSLKVRGDATADRSLSFFKPGLTLDWRLKSGLHAQASLKRTVAQLDFYDFVSSAELTSDRVNGGNANLLPQRAWEARLTVQKPILGDGLAKVELGLDRISLLQDRILTDDGFDAPGNIGSGRRKFAALTLDAPLASIGIKGARVKFFGRIQDTKVDDPVSGSSRAFSGFWPKWEWNAEYRHDLGKFAYGMALFDRSEFCFYRVDEVDCNFNDKVYTTAFVEYRPTAKTTLTFDVDNATSTHGQRRRTFSFPDRSADPSLVEFRDRNNHRAFTLTIKQQFG
ncbi:TonB-dependent receptor [Sphingomonas jaspsi]|uniref:TonB-dependent receptor n=1 Tax=Sphingomonas jaspsi TaxID=392409 RepID=UPI0004ADF51D|nr:TonB-dependent receptor [Sphingomonas jaspsi]